MKKLCYFLAILFFVPLIFGCVGRDSIYKVSKLSNPTPRWVWGGASRGFGSVVDLPGITVRTDVANTVLLRCEFGVGIEVEFFSVKTECSQGNPKPRFWVFAMQIEPRFAMQIDIELEPSESGYSFNPEKARILRSPLPPVGDKIIPVSSAEGVSCGVQDTYKMCSLDWKLGKLPSHLYLASGVTSLMSGTRYHYTLRFGTYIQPEEEFILDFTEALLHISSRKLPLLHFKEGEFKVGVS